jgi:crotonobetainyl-CoA:carnitine CoA-transferase CaiB-like acyl-CoA transferase
VIDGPGQGPLTGIRVLDCGQLIAGGMLGMMLGDFGGDVIKVEHPGPGDPLRSFGRRRGDVPLYWKHLSRNKRSITLALNKEEGQALFRQLVATVQPDVIIESFRPGTLERWGLGPDALGAIRPGLILARVSGFGQTGPYRERPGFGTLAESMSGFAHMTGQRDGPPTLPPIALADSIAALYGTVGVLLALRARDTPGGLRVQVVDASLLDSLFSLLGNQLIEYDQLGIVASRDGNRAPTSAPRNLFATRDGLWVALVAPTPNVFMRLVQAIGHPELADDPRFSSNASRLENVVALDEVIADWAAQQSRDEIVDQLVAAEVPVAPVADMAMLAVDPHLVARDMVVSIDDPELSSVKMPGIVPRLSVTPGSIRSSAPTHGSSNEEVYTTMLGLPSSEIARLKSSGTI